MSSFNPCGRIFFLHDTSPTEIYTLSLHDALPILGTTMKKTIVLLPGDGIGPEVTRAAAAVLRESAQEFNHQFDFMEFPIGGAAIDAAGTPLPSKIGRAHV